MRSRGDRDAGRTSGSGGSDAPREVRKVEKRSTSNVFTMFSQSQIQEFKEVRMLIHSLIPFSVRLIKKTLIFFTEQEQMRCNSRGFHEAKTTETATKPLTTGDHTYNRQTDRQHILKAHLAIVHKLHDGKYIIY